MFFTFFKLHKFVQMYQIRQSVRIICRAEEICWSVVTRQVVAICSSRNQCFLKLHYFLQEIVSSFMEGWFFREYFDDWPSETIAITAWKVGSFSGPYFPVFGANTEINPHLPCHSNVYVKVHQEYGSPFVPGPSPV